MDGYPGFYHAHNNRGYHRCWGSAAHIGGALGRGQGHHGRLDCDDAGGRTDRGDVHSASRRHPHRLNIATLLSQYRRAQKTIDGVWVVDG